MCKMSVDFRHEHIPFSCSICNLFAISRQGFASMTSVTIFYINNAVTEDGRTNAVTGNALPVEWAAGRREKNPTVSHGDRGRPVVADPRSSQTRAGEIFETWKCLIDIGFKIGEHYLNTY